jgi:hypothetical protein
LLSQITVASKIATAVVPVLFDCAGSHDAAQTATAAHAAAAKAAAAQATAAAQGVLQSAAASCHIEQGAEYSGDVIKWGEHHLQVSQQLLPYQLSCDQQPSRADIVVVSAQQ